MSKFRIMKKTYDSVENWTVERMDGKVIKDAISGYNFELKDWQLAIDCAKQLEKESEGEE